MWVGSQELTVDSGLWTHCILSVVSTLQMSKLATRPYYIWDDYKNITYHLLPFMHCSTKSYKHTTSHHQFNSNVINNFSTIIRTAQMLSTGREVSSFDGQDRMLPEASCFVDAKSLSSASIVEQTSLCRRCCPGTCARTGPPVRRPHTSYISLQVRTQVSQPCLTIPHPSPSSTINQSCNLPFQT